MSVFFTCMLAPQAEPQVSALCKSHHPLYRQYQPVSFCTFCSVTCTVISCWSGLLLPCTLYKSWGCADTRGLWYLTSKTTKTSGCSLASSTWTEQPFLACPRQAPAEYADYA